MFFGNKLSVKFFFSQKPFVPSSVKFGCMGTAASAELRAFGKRADFIGTSTDIKLVGKQFSSKVGNGRVMFAIARGSQQFLQWQMVKQQNIFNLEIYATLKNSLELETDFDFLIFTSPQNLESYLEKNKLVKGQKIIAMGEAVTKLLFKNKIKEYIIPQSLDDLGIVRAVLSN
jgi:uroporphyrinogen-III synthase